MKRIRALSLLTALMVLVCCLPVHAAETDWLIPKQRDYRSFTDTAGTICEKAAATCCQAGLMDGVDIRHFLPEVSLSHAQTIVIAARFHRLLSGGSLDYFEPISKTGPDWWTPYDSYLTEEIPALADAAWYQSGKADPTAPCSRENFFRLLAAVLEDLDVTLPEINAVEAVPDCDDDAILPFYRWGILNGKDEYGSLHGSAALSRAAAAAMLARLIDPDQRLEFEPETLELCRELLGVAPETVLMRVSGREITAEQFMPALVSTVSYYNHSHFAAMTLEMNGGSVTGEAVELLCRQVLAETLARELGLDITPSDTRYFPGYRGLTVEGQAWENYHSRLLEAVKQALGSFPEEQLPPPEYTAVWGTLPLNDLSFRVRSLPYWGGQF